MLDIRNMKLPERDRFPAWYGLRTTENGLIIDVHKLAFEFMHSLKYEGMLIIKEMMQRFQFDDFIPPTLGPWGFGRRIFWEPEVPLQLIDPIRDGWISWECIFPRYQEERGHREFFQVRVTLCILFQILELFSYEHDTKYTQPQLMVIRGLSIKTDLHGGSLWATLTPVMMKYLHHQEDNSRLVAAEQSMRRISHHMLGKPEEYDDTYYYKVWCRQPKRIDFSVPGNACDLNPDDCHDKQLDVGYSLCPHNVDSSFQQLALLTGLAKLHELAAEYLYAHT